MYRILLFLFFLFPVANGIAQVKPFRFGVRVAPDIAWMSPDTEDYANEGAVAGFSWGFVADITLTDNYFIKTGFSIDYLGGKMSYPGQQLADPVTNQYIRGELNRKYNLRYLEVPATIKMRTNRFDNAAFYGEIGFGASFNLKARAKDEFYPENGGAAQESEVDIKDDVNLFKGSLIVGAGVEYFIDESTSIFTSVTFNNGLTNILNSYNPVDESLKERASLYYFQLNIGVMF